MRRTLDAAIDAAPDDPARYLVLADWLQTEGDPRGSLISAQHRLRSASAAERPELERAVAHLLDAHTESFFGPGACLKALTLSWRWGFIHEAFGRRARVVWQAGGGSIYRPQPVALTGEVGGTAPELEVLLTHPSGRFLQHFGATAADVEVLTRVGHPALRRLTLSADEVEDPPEVDLQRLLAALPALREVSLDALAVSATPLRHPHLRTLDLTLGNADPLLDAADAFVLPALTSFSLDVERTTPTDKHLEALLRALSSHRLEHLGLRGWTFRASHIETLLRSPVVATLKSLDLYESCRPEAGAALVESAAKLEHLERLDVFGVSDAHERALRRRPR